VIERIRIQDDLRLKDLALNAAANAVVITGKDAQIKWANRAFSKLSGYSLSEAIGHFPKKLVKSGMQGQGYYEALWQTILSGEVWHGELVNRRKDGSLYHEEMTITPVPDAQGEITHFIAVKQDITERKQAEELLRESEQRFRQLAENIREAFWMTDPAKNKMLYISPAYEQIWGRTLQSIYDSPRAWLEAIHGEDRQRVLQAALTKQAVGLYDEEYRIVRPNGEVRWIRDRAFPVRDSGGVVYRIVGVAEDITERKAAEEQIRNLAFYDALTQLPNRRLLNDRMGTAMAASKRSGHYGALMFLDLDNFKPLNDTHGHDMGDFLLVEAARRISSCVREVDTVARFGGDEFVVMLSELDADKAESTAQASIVAEKIRAILAEPYVLKLQQADNAETAIEHHCAASIGVVVFNSEASAEDILKWADMAMYQAKEGGRNLVRFFDSES